MELKQCIFTKNDCYKKATKMTPKGIAVHSTGANNPTLRRYVQPDDGLLGKNTNNNHWNRSGVDKCVHGFIGKDKNGNVQVYQTLPFNIACWGIGKGKKGSYNYDPTGHIQFEICEDALNDEKYFNEAFGKAIEFCAYLCKEFNLSVDTIVSHNEAAKKGYGSNHADCDHWLKKFGKDMNWFRNEVKAKLDGGTKDTTPKGTEVNYKVRITADVLNVREEPNTKSKVVTTIKKNEVYTIVEESKTWGKLKSGAGWISLNYTEKVNEEYPTKEVYNCTSLNVRNKASIFGKKLGVLKKGEKVKVYQTKGSWSKVAKTSEKWVSSKYLK
jgi:hypothetical protein